MILDKLWVEFYSKLIEDTIGDRLNDMEGEQPSAFKTSGLFFYVEANLVSIDLLDPDFFEMLLTMPIYGPEEEDLYLEYFSSNMKVSTGDLILKDTLNELKKGYPDIILGYTKDNSSYGVYYENEFVVPQKMIIVNLQSSADPEKTMSLNW